MMLQYCSHLNRIETARRAGHRLLIFDPKWESRYEVLGDDIVIFDKNLANQYLILCKGLGVEININKSIVAENNSTVEFAKRTGKNGIDLSMLSFKEFISNNNFFGRLDMTTRLISRS